MEVFVCGGGLANGIEGYLHQFYSNFEHEIGCSGGSGDSGGIFTILLRVEFLFGLALQNHERAI